MFCDIELSLLIFNRKKTACAILTEKGQINIYIYLALIY